ncbi:hypothetical protein Pan216_46830 [Planctomycetes bacterium Pan216]|uniref:2-phospho-L-lactate guanylyltransferase n=1 Tax=Kolteria novifilia TaxID=2527975 RepID=A0A518B9Z1_9BACT|nr:hypothetical protein Pan216_46830 [Planctomycetes bacterium Pan216]
MTMTIVVFLKYPAPGRCKTRLAASIGPEAAAELYREWIALVLGQLQEFRGEGRLLGYCDGAPVEDFAPWKDLVDGWWVQPEGPLDRRLDAAFRQGHHDSARVIALGSDCLDIDASLVRAGFDALATHDVVLGPAFDGGYYLVGTSRHLPGLFDDVRWSCADTLADQRKRCQDNDWSHTLLSPRGDIDTWDDWRAYCERRGIEPAPSSFRGSPPPSP